VTLLELLRDLFVCEQQSTSIVEWFEALVRDIVDIKQTDSVRNHQLAVEQVQALSASVTDVRLTIKSRELVILSLLRGSELGGDDLCIDLNQSV
jgi:hypothetical protein